MKCLHLPQIHMLKPPEWWYLEMGLSGSDGVRWGHEGGALTMESVPLWEDMGASLLSLSSCKYGARAMWAHSEKAAYCKPGTQLPPQPNHADILTLSPQTVRKQVPTV